MSDLADIKKRIGAVGNMQEYSRDAYSEIIKDLLFMVVERDKEIVRLREMYAESFTV